jgi:hypothetical protein
MLRIRRNISYHCYFVLHTSSVKNRRFLTASPQGEAFGCLLHRYDKLQFSASSQIPAWQAGIFCVALGAKTCYTDVDIPDTEGEFLDFRKTAVIFQSNAGKTDYSADY